MRVLSLRMLALFSLMIMLGSLMGCLSVRGSSRDGGADDDDSAANDDDASDDDDAVGDDDDDAVGDDDDAVGDDDDDDAADDDDATAGFEAEALTFEGLLDVSPFGGSATVQYTFNYWGEYSQSAQTLTCKQVIEINAEVQSGPGLVPTCSNCTGIMIVDPNSYTDISNPAANPDHCDPEVLEAEGADYGVAFTLTEAQGGMFGDLGTVALMDDSVHADLGIDWLVNGGMDAATLESDLDQSGLDYTASGLDQAIPGSFAETGGLSGASNPAGPGSDWYGFWYIFRNPNDNGHESTGSNGFALVGEYGMAGIWIITLSG